MPNNIHHAGYTRQQTIAVLVGSSVMLTMSMGMRQSWGLFSVPITDDLGISVADFMLAIAVQNLVWGATQPIVGAYADKFGSRMVVILGTILYAAGIGVTMAATDTLMLIVGLGFMIGLAMSCTALMLAMAASARAVSVSRRTFILGIISAMGSVGSFIAAPLAEGLISTQGWLIAMVAFIGLCVVMLPAAFFVGSGDKAAAEIARTSAEPDANLSLKDALKNASRHSGYVITAVAFFVCGLQLIFIAMHLPNYIALCGLDPSLGAWALGTIGAFNAIGCYLLGWLGDKYPKNMVLGAVYVLRSIFIVIYFLVPATPASTLLFAAIMGILWLGIAPVLAGFITQIFGLKYVATLTGIAFFFHQVGSFIGVWGAGLIVDTFGSYDRAWQTAVLIGLIAGFAQILASDRPAPKLPEPAAA
tara:strand:+ start:5339 stop:6592 length:1254 start_codon:yes stop_codon:yes gene_type:complete